MVQEVRGKTEERCVQSTWTDGETRTNLQPLGTTGDGLKASSTGRLQGTVQPILGRLVIDDTDIGDCKAILPEIVDHTLITEGPYVGLRDYGFVKQAVVEAAQHLSRTIATESTSIGTVLVIDNGHMNKETMVRLIGSLKEMQINVTIATEGLQELAAGLQQFSGAISVDYADLELRALALMESGAISRDEWNQGLMGINHGERSISISTAFAFPYEALDSFFYPVPEAAYAASNWGAPLRDEPERGKWWEAGNTPGPTGRPMKHRKKSKQARLARRRNRR